MSQPQQNQQNPQNPPRSHHSHKRGPTTDIFDLPIWRLEVEYEKMLRMSLTRSSYVRASTHVYDFLRAFPKKSLPADFYVTDVEDYLLKVERERGKGVARTAQQQLRAFFNWLKSEKGMRFANPVARKKHPRHRREAPHIELEALTKLCLVAQRHPRDQAIVQLALKGIYGLPLAKQVGIHSGTVRKRYAHLCNEAGFPPVHLRLLNRAYKRLCMRLGEEMALRQLGFASSLSDLPVPETAHNIPN